MPAPTSSERVFARLSDEEREFMTQWWLAANTQDPDVVADYELTIDTNIRFEKP